MNVNDEDLIEAIAEVVRDQPGLDEFEIADALLGILGVETIPGFVGFVLQKHADWFLGVVDRASGRTHWCLKNTDLCVRFPRESDSPGEVGNTTPATGPAVKGAVQEPQGPSEIFASRLALYPWQRRAARCWAEAGFTGVVEAVTGTGKTRLAIHAIATHLDAGWKVAVVVPTLDLVRQWSSEIEQWVNVELGMEKTIAKLGGGSTGSLMNADLLIATAQSASQQSIFTPTHRGLRGLLIADECHHYGADTWSRALQRKFEHRLGLTATFEREDDGCERFLKPYFGRAVYALGYEEALRDRVIAPFKIAFIGTNFNAQEAASYYEADDRARYYRGQLISLYGLPEQPFGEFMKAVAYVRTRSDGPASKMASFYLGAFTKRRLILASARGKLEAMRSLVPAIRAADRTVVFAQTKEAAQSAVDLVSSHGIEAAVLDSTMEIDERRRVLAEFEDGTQTLLAAPKLMDEGVNVPAADLGIVLATSRSRRQLIQRMGRVLRKKPDDACARIAILFVEGTAEDPEQGAHEDFMELIEGVAIESRTFPSGADSDRLCDYLLPCICF